MNNTIIMLETKHASVSNLQNLTSFAVFFGLVGAETFAWMLYNYPTSSWLWALSLSLNRFAASILDPLHNLVDLGPITSIILFFSLSLLPLLAGRYRHWLGTAVCIHAALGICFSAFWYELNHSGAYLKSASLSENTLALVRWWSFEASILGILVVTLTVLCAVSHIRFFHQSGA